jgi:hypothetical protein
MNGLIGWGIALVIIGLVLGLLGVAGFLAGTLQWLGWLVLLVGIVLAIVHFAGRGRTTTPGRRV